MRTIVPIVEGHGEERAVPLLVRRWLEHRRFHRYFQVPERAINAKGSGRLKAAFDRERHVGIEHYIQAALRNHPAAILVVLDADDECQRRGTGLGLGPELLARAKQVASTVPVSVVVAHREYEAWFLASLQPIRAAGLLPERGTTPDPLDPEAITGCKGRIEALIGRGYEETVDQFVLTKGLSFSRARQRSASFGKLMRDLEQLTQEARRRRTP